jgi:PAS domain S-box-containing protein
VECQHLRKDGSVLFVELTTQAHVFAEEPAQLVQVIDMTERRRAATALLASEERFRAVVENLTEGLLLHDASGRILYANPSMAELVGCTSAELDAISAGQLLNPPQGAALAFERQQYETELKRRDGSAVSVAIKTSPLTKANGDTIATVAVVTDLSARKAAAAEIAQSQARLIEVSRLAGMAEVATGVLHNVGNVLNSVNVSATVVGDRLRQSRISGLQRAVRLLEQHAGNLGKFFTEDPKGKLLPDYLGKLYWQLDNERNELVGELAGLTKNLGHIKEIVAMQQTYAKVDGLTEAVSPAVLLEDALRLNEESLVRNSVTVDRDYDATAPTVTVDKHKVLEILVNLITNARHAVCDAARPDRKIRVRVAQTCNRRVSVEVQDNGVGIPQENLVRIFQHGFTTKKNGHGFGLHSGALAARQMGGSLTVNSEGPGQGATFKLELPIGETKPAPN